MNENLNESVNLLVGKKKSEAGNVEIFEGLPVIVNDSRNKDYLSFDLQKFLDMIARIRKDGLFKVSRDYGPKDFGKYVYLVASSESNNWADSIKRAVAIEVNLFTRKNRGVKGFVGLTDVEVKIIMDKGEGRKFQFSFNTDGTYRNCDWEDAYYTKRLIGGDTSGEFSLDEIKEPQKQNLLNQKD